MRTKTTDRVVAAAVLSLGLLSAGHSAHAQTVRDIISFTASTQWGDPAATPAQGRDGKLYGTFPSPESTSGSDFSLSLTGDLQVLHLFGSEAGGFFPLAGLTLGSDGNFYGATSSGGTAELGTLYRLSPGGTFTILHNFLGGSDGSGPLSAPILAADGNFYGTTAGTVATPATVYKYDPSSGTLATIYVFDFLHGTNVAAGLLQASDGYLYGVATDGGSHDYGTVFKLDTSGKLFFYYSFPGGAGGRVPIGPLVEATDGNIYGTTYLGGSTPKQGYGTVFRTTPQGAVSILFSFDPATTAYNPLGGLIQATDGYLYGTLSLSKKNEGALFRISLSGQYEALYLFPQTVGSGIGSSLMQDTNGMFYGSAEYGGAYGFGAIYSLNMGLRPFVAFVRANGKTGEQAQILGQGLTGTTSVTFNGAPAKFKAVSDTYMTAIVPSGATTGPVVVTTPTGPLTSNVSFRISK
jgi:uncharacterized repeat protein (TIGR03803 family)